MSKAKTKVNLIYGGIGSILRSQEMAACLKAEADRIAANCGAGYASDVKNMGTRQVASVFTETKEAVKDNLVNKTMLKAFGGNIKIAKGK